MKGCNQTIHNVAYIGEGRKPQQIRRIIMKKNLIVVFLIGMVCLTGCGNVAQNTGVAGEKEAVSHVVESGKPAETGNSTDAGYLTVNAEGESKTTPDMAEITVGIEATEATTEEAQRKNNEDVNAVLQKLKELGIEEKSIQTSDYSLYPRYDEFGEEITGYYVRTTLTVSDIPIDKAGETLSALGESGMTEVDYVRYFSSSYDEAYEDALKEAVAAAEKKAESLAETAGKTLGTVVEMTEGYQDTSLRYSYDNGAAKYAATEEAMGGGGDVAISPGEVTISAQITIKYALR